MFDYDEYDLKSVISVMSEALLTDELIQMVANVKNIKCTWLKAVSYPDTRHLIKGSTVKPRKMPVYFIFSVMGWRF